MKTLKAFIERALEEEADAISIEYKDGYEEVCLLKGSLGIGLDKIKSNSDQGRSLFDELANIEAQKIHNGWQSTNNVERGHLR